MLLFLCRAERHPKALYKTALKYMGSGKSLRLRYDEMNRRSTGNSIARIDGRGRGGYSCIPVGCSQWTAEALTQIHQNRFISVRKGFISRISAAIDLWEIPLNTTPHEIENFTRKVIGHLPKKTLPSKMDNDIMVVSSK